MAVFQLGKTEMAQRRKTFSIALGCLLLGVGVGALAGLFTAPKSGRQLRRDVRAKYDGAREAMDEAIDQMSQRANELLKRGGELAEAARRTAEPVTRILRRAS
jgi:gas vesicle protein